MRAGKVSEGWGFKSPPDRIGLKKHKIGYHLCSRDKATQ